MGRFPIGVPIPAWAPGVLPSTAVVGAMPRSVERTGPDDLGTCVGGGPGGGGGAPGGAAPPARAPPPRGFLDSLWLLWLSMGLSILAAAAAPAAAILRGRREP